MDELRYEESENLPEEVVQESGIKNKRKSIPKVTGQKTIFLFVKEIGRTWQPTITVAETTGKPKSRNLSVNWQRHEHSPERDTDGAIHWKIICPKLTIRF